MNPKKWLERAFHSVNNRRTPIQRGALKNSRLKAADFQINADSVNRVNTVVRDWSQSTRRGGRVGWKNSMLLFYVTHPHILAE